MEPILRAAADRLIHHTAYLAYVAGEMTPEELEERCEASGYTMRETIGHCVLWMERFVSLVHLLLTEGAAAYERPNADAVNADEREAMGSDDREGLLRRMAVARDAIIAEYATATAPRLSEPLHDDTIGETIHRWTAHLERHALDFAETLPELRYDPLLLDWALSANLKNADEAARQAKFIEDVRAYLASLPDDEDDDEDEDENEAE